MIKAGFLFSDRLLTVCEDYKGSSASVFHFCVLSNFIVLGSLNEYKSESSKYWKCSEQVGSDCTEKLDR